MLVLLTHYFKLQLTLTNRWFKDGKVDPKFGYILLIGCFISFSVYLFFRISFANYLYPVLALSPLSKLAGKPRNEFLKTSYGDKRYLLIRIVENTVITFPFVVFLIYKLAFYEAVFLVIASGFMALSPLKTQFNFTLPSPFYKKPFEFTVGFRKAYLSFIAAYVLSGIAVNVHNFNLGIFALLLIFIVSISFYANPENEYYVWSYKLSPKQFLLEKSKIALMYSNLSALPLCALLAVSFPQNALVILLCPVIAAAYLLTSIFAKYASYPNEMGLQEGFLLAVSLTFPPLLLFTIPYFYRRAISSLNTLLP